MSIQRILVEKSYLAFGYTNIVLRMLMVYSPMLYLENAEQDSWPNYIFLVSISAYINSILQQGYGKSLLNNKFQKYNVIRFSIGYVCGAFLISLYASVFMAEEFTNINIYVIVPTFLISIAPIFTPIARLDGNLLLEQSVLTLALLMGLTTITIFSSYVETAYTAYLMVSCILFLCVIGSALVKIFKSRAPSEVANSIRLSPTELQDFIVGASLNQLAFLLLSFNIKHVENDSISFEFVLCMNVSQLAYYILSSNMPKLYRIENTNERVVKTQKVIFEFIAIYILSMLIIYITSKFLNFPLNFLEFYIYAVFFFFMRMSNSIAVLLREIGIPMFRMIGSTVMTAMIGCTIFVTRHSSLSEQALLVIFAAAFLFALSISLLRRRKRLRQNMNSIRFLRFASIMVLVSFAVTTANLLIAR